MCDGGGDVLCGSFTLYLAREKKETDVRSASREDIEHILNYGTGGGGDEGNSGWDCWNATLSFLCEEALGLEASFESLELCVEQALSTGAHALDAQLVGAARLVE